MLVLLFDIMGFGIVGGYLSKLCVTVPHMSISPWAQTAGHLRLRAYGLPA